MMPLYVDPNKKNVFFPAMNPMLNPSQIKYPQAFNHVIMGGQPIQNPMVNPQSEAQDKILKDQNYLSSDDKLYEGIIHHGLSLKNVFAECQFSEKLLGSYIFRAIKKAVFDPNTVIFKEESNSNTFKNNNESDNFGIKEIEIVENIINDIIQDSGKVPKIPDTSSIFEKFAAHERNNLFSLRIDIPRSNTPLYLSPALTPLSSLSKIFTCLPFGK